MADKRKLQGEIDRCLKRVVEGVEQFEDIWQKVHNASNANQKEKYEADLKKEIKKLQRLRDQIKTWLASNDIKDKRPLMEKRRLIETQMERFKVVERETKTKAYSKEGLGLATKVDPAQREKEEMRQWLTDSIDKLHLQIDQFESEVESVYAGSKKKKLDRDRSDRVEELQGWVERHKYHIQKLETIMRMMDNCSLETDAVKEIVDDLNYYLECNQEPDFAENEMIYEDMDLEDTQSGVFTATTPLAGGTAHPLVPEEEFNSIPSSPSSSQGPLSPKTPTTMKSTSQELFEERRRGKTTSLSGLESIPNDTQPQTQPTTHVPPSPKRPSGKPLLSNSTLPSRAGNGSGGGASTEATTSKATTPTSTKVNSLPNSKAPSVPQQLPSELSTAQRGKAAPPPSGTAYSIAAGGHQNSGVPVAIATQLPLAPAVPHNAHELVEPLPPQAAAVSSGSPTIPLTVTPTVEPSTAQPSTSSLSPPTPAVVTVTSTATSQSSVSSYVSHQPQISTQTAVQPGNAAQPRPPGPGSHQTQHSRSSSGSSSLSISTLSQDSLHPPHPSPAPHTVVAAPVTAAVSEGQVSHQQTGPITPAPSESSVETSNHSPSSQSSSFSPADVVSNAQPSTPPPSITATSQQYHQPFTTRTVVTEISQSAASMPALSAGLLTQASSSETMPVWMVPVSSQGSVALSVVTSTGPAVSGGVSTSSSSIVSALSQVPPPLPSPPSSPSPSTFTLTSAFIPAEPLSSTTVTSLSSLSSLKSMAAQVVASSTAVPSAKPETSVSMIRPMLDSLVVVTPGPRLDNGQTRTDMQLEPLLGVTPLGPVQLNQEKLYQLKMLEGACKHLPQASDSERVRPYLQRTPYPTPYYHHQHPPPHFDSFDFFQRLSIETLFFVFYYMEGTKAQYMAAKALKKLSWRFHSKYMMWFQRLEEPKAITDDYEMGTYIYFDFEKWSQRKKEGFTFEYRYLEDKDLP